MKASFRALPVCALILASGCTAEPPCAPPAAGWAKAAPADADTIVLDQYDRVSWNGKLISLKRLRNPLIEADAAARTVRFVPAPGAKCRMIERVRFEMESTLSCAEGRCLEAMPAQ